MRAAYLELHIAVFLFGISGLFGKLLDDSPVTIVLGRTLFAAIAIYIGLKLFRKSLSASPKSLLLMSLSGVVLAMHWAIFFHSIQLSSVAIGLIGFSTFPLFVTLLEPLIFAQRYRATDLLTAVLVFFGLLLVVPEFDLGNSATLGLLWAILSGALFAVLTLINRKLVETNSFLTVAFFQHSSAAVCMLPFVVVAANNIDANSLLLLLILGVVCTALPQILFIKSLKRVKAQLASIVAGLEPVYGIGFAALLLGEVPTLQTIVGAGIVFAAVILAMKLHTIPGAVPPENKDGT